MSEAPDRIWAYVQSGTLARLWRPNADHKKSTEYVRADLYDQQAAEIERLKARIAEDEAVLEQIEAALYSGLARLGRDV